MPCLVLSFLSRPGDSSPVTAPLQVTPEQNKKKKKRKNFIIIMKECLLPMATLTNRQKQDRIYFPHLHSQHVKCPRWLPMHRAIHWAYMLGLTVQLLRSAKVYLCLHTACADGYSPLETNTSSNKSVIIQSFKSFVFVGLDAKTLCRYNDRYQKNSSPPHQDQRWIDLSA